MMTRRFQVPLGELDRATLELIARHLSELTDVLVDVNNGLVARLEGAPAEVQEPLAEWSKVVNGTIEASNAEVRRILGIERPAASDLN